MINALRQELETRTNDTYFISGVCSFMKKYNKVSEMIEYLKKHPDADQNDIGLFEYELLKPIISTKEHQIATNERLKKLGLV